MRPSRGCARSSFSGRFALMILLAFVMSAPLVGCATSNSNADEVATQSVEDKLYDYRTIVREHRSHPLVAEVARELDMVDAWIERAGRMIADDEDEELIELQLEAIEGQLVQVRSYYARREAELSLERSRSSYEQKMKQIQSERDRNDAQLDPLDQGGSR